MYNILYQIWWSQSIVESKIDLTRFFPVKCEVAKIMTRVELGFVDGSGFRASVRKLIYMPETIQTFFFLFLRQFQHHR